MIEISSGLPRKSSVMFGNLRTFSEHVRQRSCDLRTNFGESSEIFGKWSEILRRSLARRYEFYVCSSECDIVLAIRT